MCDKDEQSEQLLYAVGYPELVLQQPFFTPQAAGVTGEAFVCTNNAVAGHDDGYFVAAIGVGGGTYYFGVAHALCQVSVADGFAVRYFQQLVPYGLLKSGAVLVNGDVEIFAAACKKLNQLFGAMVYDVANAGFAVLQLPAVVYKT